MRTKFYSALPTLGFAAAALASAGHAGVPAPISPNKELVIDTRLRLTELHFTRPVQPNTIWNIADATDFGADDFTDLNLALSSPGHPQAAGSGIGVLVGPGGVFMVDATYAPLSDRVAATIRKLSSGAPIRFLVDIHSHPDHTGGNPNFAKQGALVIAGEEAWQTLSRPFPPAGSLRVTC
jgi:glyoxylase-like metal-dependent hydrolase (beta-lactamase superfamily II)